MNARFFLDTNILVYSFDLNEKRKMEISGDLIGRGIRTGQGLVSYQVVQEFFNLAFKKFPVPLSEAEAHSYFISVLRPMLGVSFSPALLLRALGLRERHNLQWYDALIVSAAIEGKCEILYTEDLQHDIRIAGIRVQNPFVRSEPRSHP